MNNTVFNSRVGPLTLLRFPLSKDKSLQAWDSADEFLIEYMSTLAIELSKQRLWILNDEFGALTCAFCQFSPSVVTDSWLSQCAINHNIAKNQLQQTVMFIDPIDLQREPSEVNDKIDTMLIKIPKTLALLEYQLGKLKPKLHPNSLVIAAGKVKQVTSSVLTLFEKYIGTTTTSLAQKKSRLIFATPELTNHHLETSRFPLIISDSTLPFDLYNHANVFCREQLDIGARFLLNHLPDNYQHVLDLGCGNGVLGVFYLRKNTQATATFVDESYMAIASARATATHAGVSERTAYFLSHSLRDVPAAMAGQFDLILCNPPFHQKNAITEDIALQMFRDAKHFLAARGEMRIVANRHLNYIAHLRKLYGRCDIVARSNKFNVYCVRKKA